MGQFVPLSRKALAGKGWKRTKSLTFAAGDQLIPLVAQELAAVAPEMPICFVQDGAHFRIVALTSHRPNDNLFVDPLGQWLVHYTPLMLQVHPFRLARDPESGKSIPCVDEASLSEAADGEPFFEGDKPSKLVEQALGILQTIERGALSATQAIAALANTGVIVPWELKFNAGQQMTSLTGIYRIDEMALNKLTDAEFLKLRNLGAIPLAYAQLMSMRQTHLLAKLFELQQQLRTTPKIAVSKNDIREMFNLDDGTIQF